MTLIHVQPLRAHRIAARLSQDELALRAGVSQTLISAFERGVTTPAPEQLSALARVLGVPIVDLLDEEAP